MDRQTAMHSTTLTLVKSVSDAGKQTMAAGKLHKAYSDDNSNTAYLQYSLLQEKPIASKRWLANVSHTKQIKYADMLSINVTPSANKTDFEVIKGLLSAKTCHTILFDKQFSLAQTTHLKDLARFSGTRLVFVNNIDNQDLIISHQH